MIPYPLDTSCALSTSTLTSATSVDSANACTKGAIALQGGHHVA